MSPRTKPQPMKQPPPQNKARTEAFPRHEPLPCPPDAWHGLERVKTDHKTSLNWHSHKPQPMRAVERKRLAGRIADGRRPPMAMLTGAG